MARLYRCPNPCGGGPARAARPAILTLATSLHKTASGRPPGAGNPSERRQRSGWALRRRHDGTAPHLLGVHDGAVATNRGTERDRIDHRSAREGEAGGPPWPARRRDGVRVTTAVSVGGALAGLDHGSMVRRRGLLPGGGFNNGQIGRPKPHKMPMSRLHPSNGTPY